MKKNNSFPTRLAYVDFLKFIGISLIILAHVKPPVWLRELRNFDVPMMVILSAYLGAASFSRRYDVPGGTKCFYISRIKRLAVPTWIFLVIFFLVESLAFGVLHDFSYYVESFLFTTYAIGYVWIILIYMYSALLTPVFVRYGRTRILYAAVLAAYMLYEFIARRNILINNKLFYTLFYYFIPYGVMSFFGYVYSYLKMRDKIVVSGISFLIFAAFALRYRYVYGSFQVISFVKFPPRLYFLSYGLAVSYALMMLGEKFFDRLGKLMVIKYISEHSLWIYLWHILVLLVYEKLRLPPNWIIKYTAVFLMSICLVIIVNRILDAVLSKRNIRILSYFRG